jgi:hypothetical protein
MRLSSDRYHAIIDAVAVGLFKIVWGFVFLIFITR